MRTLLEGGLVSRSKAAILAVVVLVVALFAWAGVAQAFPTRDLPPGLSAADWAAISGQIAAGEPEMLPHLMAPAFGAPGHCGAQQAYLKASNTGASDRFGYSVAVSGDTVVVGACREDSSATGVNGDQSDNSAYCSGRGLRLRAQRAAPGRQQAYLKASNTGAGDYFGYSVAISGDTVVVGAYGEDSNATGVNGDQSDNSAADSGAAYVFVRSGTTWTPAGLSQGLQHGRGRLTSATPWPSRATRWWSGRIGRTATPPG